MDLRADHREVLGSHPCILECDAGPSCDRPPAVDDASLVVQRFDCPRVHRFHAAQAIAPHDHLWLDALAVVAHQHLVLWFSLDDPSGLHLPDTYVINAARCPETCIIQCLIISYHANQIRIWLQKFLPNLEEERYLHLGCREQWEQIGRAWERLPFSSNYALSWPLFIQKNVRGGKLDLPLNWTKRYEVINPNFAL